MDARSTNGALTDPDTDPQQPSRFDVTMGARMGARLGVSVGVRLGTRLTPCLDSVMKDGIEIAPGGESRRRLW